MKRLLTVLTLLCLCSAVQSQDSQNVTPAKGPLRVLDSNPRWFTDGSGRAIALAGSHVWQSLQDNGLLIRGATSNPRLSGFSEEAQSQLLPPLALGDDEMD